MKNADIIKLTILTTILLAIAYLPFYINWRNSPQNTTYSFLHGEYADYYSYLSYIRQGKTYNNLLRTFITEENKTSYIHLYYLLLGKIGNIFKLSEIALYHSSIAVSLILFVIYCWRIVSIAVPKHKWLTLYLIFFAGTPHLFTLPSINIPIGTGFWTKMDIYARITHLPHHFISISLFVAAVYYFLSYLKKNNRISIITCSILLFFSVIFFPVPGFVFIISFILSLLFTFREKQSRPIIKNCSYLFYIIISFLAGFAFSFIQLEKSGIAVWEYEFFKPEKWPHLFSIFIYSYGILLFFIPFGFIQIYKHLSAEKIFISSLFLLPPLCYLLSVVGILPITKIRFIYTAPYVFGSIVGVWGIQYLFSLIKNGKTSILVRFLIVFLIITSTYVDLKAYWLPRLNPVKPYQNLYIPQKYMKELLQQAINTGQGKIEIQTDIEDRLGSPGWPEYQSWENNVKNYCGKAVISLVIKEDNLIFSYELPEHENHPWSGY